MTRFHPSKGNWDPIWGPLTSEVEKISKPQRISKCWKIKVFFTHILLSTIIPPLGFKGCKRYES